MRTLLLVPVLAVLRSASAAADTPAVTIVEDAALGIELAADRKVLSDGHAAALVKCSTDGASNGALFWLEISRAGAVTVAKVRGTGKPAIDACFASALRKATTADKLAGPIVLVGHIDLALADRSGIHPAPRQSKTAVMLPPHSAAWQLSVNHLGYTANRAADIAQALDATSATVAACAAKRGSSAAAAQGIAWLDGKAIVRSGTPAYDDCVAKALDAIKLPTPESAAWMKLAIMAPAEPLAPRTDKAALSRDQALRDALTTAVRSRKDQVRTCLDGKPAAKLDKVSLALTATKATVAKVSTGDRDADACVKQKFGEVAIPNAKVDDKLELEVTLERQ